MTPALSLRSTLGIEREHTLDIFWKPSPELPTAQLPAPTLEIMGQVGGEPLGRSGRHLSRAGTTLMLDCLHWMHTGPERESVLG